MGNRMIRLSFLAAAAIATGSAAREPEPEIWAPPTMSSDRFESHVAFDPLNGDLYFVRSSPEFANWRIMVSACEAHGRAGAVDAPFAGDGAEADPFFSRDGRTLWFISNRTTDGVKRRDTDIWRVARGTDGKWGTPERLPAPINSDKYEWFPREGADGWLYFGSGRPGGFGRNDIYRARQDSSGTWTVENAGPNVNSDRDEAEPLLSPDARRMLIMGGDAIYESRKDNKGDWGKSVRLGTPHSANGTEIGGLFSPSGKSWLFARDVGEGRSGELLVVHEQAESWPPACPAAPEK